MGFSVNAGNYAPQTATESCVNMSDQGQPPPPPAHSGGGDHKAAKAEAKAAAAHAKAMRPWYKKKRYIGGIVILVLVIAVSTGGGGSDDDEPVASGGDKALDSGDEASDSGDDASSGVATKSGNTDNPPQADVEVTDCMTEEFIGPKAVFNVTNNSSGRSNYIIEVSFESEDGSTQYGTGTAFLNNLEPGQSKTEEAVAFEEIPDGASFNCRLVEVDRFAS